MLALLESPAPSLGREDLIATSEEARDLDLDAALARRVHRALPFDGDDEATRRLLLLALEAGMRACNANEAFRSEVRAVQLLHLVQEQSRTNDKLDRLLAQATDKARERRLTEQLFINLARRVATNVTDIDQAHRELERVVEVAADERDKDKLPANTDEAGDGRPRPGGRAQRRRRARPRRGPDRRGESPKRRARADAVLSRLYDKGIAQSILTGDVDAACRYELEKLGLDAPKPTARSEALRRSLARLVRTRSGHGPEFSTSR